MLIDCNLLLQSEIFELRESIEDNADDFTSLTNQLNELKSNTEDVCKQLEENLSRHNIKDFARNALRLKYYSKVCFLMNKFGHWFDPSNIFFSSSQPIIALVSVLSFKNFSSYMIDFHDPLLYHLFFDR